MADEQVLNTRELLDQVNVNTLYAAQEVTDLTAIKELLKNEHIFDGYKLQVEEDRNYLQHERELKSLEINKELKLKELEIRKLEIDLKREQLILESRIRSDELEFKKKQHDDEMTMRNCENHRQIDANDLKEKEINLKEEEIKQNKKRMIIEGVIKGGTVVLGAGLTWFAVCVGNEGILNKTAVSICDTLLFRRT